VAKLSCKAKTFRNGRNRVVPVRVWVVATNATPFTQVSLCSKTAAYPHKHNTNKHGLFGATPTPMQLRVVSRKMWPRVWAWAMPLRVKLVF
jgi:hypothetical protein